MLSHVLLIDLQRFCRRAWDVFRVGSPIIKCIFSGRLPAIMDVHRKSLIPYRRQFFAQAAMPRQTSSLMRC
jgi:hypothetical protein